jgi:hypothetical protein
MDIVKIGEGAMNKVFLLTMDDNSQVIARLPCPGVAYPAHYSTASEVATVTFLRDKHHLPIPKVLAWCSNPSADVNLVGAEYIIMEKADGELLASTWDAVEMFASESIAPGTQPSQVLKSDTQSKRKSVMAVIDMEANVFSAQFSSYGSLYFCEDVPEGLRRPLYAEGTPEDEFSSRYCIGPICDPLFWSLGMADIDIDRGPCMYLLLAVLRLCFDVYS